MIEFAQRLALHNATAELEALRAEGRGMVWANERAILSKETPPFAETQFTLLAVRLRATKVQVDDAILLEKLRVDIPDGESFRTVYYGPSAIYAVHVTDEAAARGIAANCEKRPAYAWELERQQRLPPPPNGGRTHDDDTNDDEIPL